MPTEAEAWAQINHRLVNLKIQQASKAFREGYSDRLPSEPRGNRWGQFVRWAEIRLERANAWTEKLYAIHLEVWDKQKRTRTPEFLRAVLQRALVLGIEASIGTAKSHLTLTATRLGMGAHRMAPLLQHLVLAKSRLISEWTTRIEIEALELQLTTQGRPLEISHPQNTSNARKGADSMTRGPLSLAESTSGGMANLPDLLNLPTGWLSSGDPVEGNPYPADDPRHRVWDDATHRADEESCRFNSHVIATSRINSPDGAVNWVCALVVGRFDIWARRGVHVVWCDAEVTAYDQWLLNYAEAWLNDLNIADSFRSLVSRDALLSEVRLHLMGRIEWWRAEARRYVSLQKTHLENGKNEMDPAAAGLTGNRAEPAQETGAQETAAGSPSFASSAERRAAVDAYINEVFREKGRRITRRDIWKSAGYRSRSEFERWERKDPKRVNKSAHERFVGILTAKPHLK
jgi:hypothetical protein